ncbi:SgcJ/EcaC family oxidoreductase [Micromonospora sp. DR5-3]|uniref:SgcJ/EcaC family oxidoreductase n=1 Tax=unclassified Micromonospora TaxID=2617518 RepID=UPI0011D31E99|nr:MULTISPECIES: SgcJ/EcaC family oxidoreductase [unclassified Micromonospora]MCW3818269.1 SgcJ/EcaC family oxidoreductase [Micromonospora sp. DR5-3]TYC21487.1 SgcJ/EcaC family oxidoreductase [Micromonospora sp. MP36]
MTSTTASTEVDRSEQAAIAAVPARMVNAWREHDADAFAGLFAEDGTLILPGVFVQGRDAIRQFMANAYAGPYRGTTVTGTPIAIRPLGPGAVALLTEGGVINAGAEELAPENAIRASWILVKENDNWVLAVYQNCPRNRS